MIPPDYCACSFFRVISVRGDDSEPSPWTSCCEIDGDENTHNIIILHNKAHLSEKYRQEKINLVSKFYIDILN